MLVRTAWNEGRDGDDDDGVSDGSGEIIVVPVQCSWRLPVFRRCGPERERSGAGLQSKLRADIIVVITTLAAARQLLVFNDSSALLLRYDPYIDASPDFACLCCFGFSCPYSTRAVTLGKPVIRHPKLENLDTKH